jgi:hypothetical protein
MYIHYYLLGYHLMELPIKVERIEMIAENTYILITLNDDIDFRPSTVKTDRIEINKDVGSTSVGIHPVRRGNRLKDLFKNFL